jgi:aryl-alcohol dehydrogenase-like predicted oxidoreductase
VALWGARHPDQLQAALGVAGWSLGAATRARIDRILSEAITDPVGPEFMAPLQRA